MIAFDHAGSNQSSTAAARLSRPTSFSMIRPLWVTTPLASSAFYTPPRSRCRRGVARRRCDPSRRC